MARTNTQSDVEELPDFIEPAQQFKAAWDYLKKANSLLQNEQTKCKNAEDELQRVQAALIKAQEEAAEAKATLQLYRDLTKNLNNIEERAAVGVNAPAPAPAATPVSKTKKRKVPLITEDFLPATPPAPPTKSPPRRKSTGGTPNTGSASASKLSPRRKSHLNPTVIAALTPKKRVRKSLPFSAPGAAQQDTSTETTKVVGVNRLNTGQWRVVCKNSKTHDIVRRSFSVKKYGEDEAKRRAIETKKNADAGISDDHSVEY